MENYSAIKDLVSDQNEYNKKDYRQKIYECFVRNYHLIRRHGKQDDQLSFTKFKKKVIPKYVNEIYLHCQQTIKKSRKQFNQKKRMSYGNSISQRKNRLSPPEQIDFSSLNKDKTLLQYVVKINKNLKFQSGAQNEQLIKQNYELGQETVHFDVGTYKLIVQPKIQTNSSDVIQDYLTQTQKNLIMDKDKRKHCNNLYVSISNQSISFPKNQIFLTTLNQICRMRADRKMNQIFKKPQKIKNSFPDEKSLEDKMVCILKQRNSNKNYRMKILSSFKKTFQGTNEKQNMSKVNEQGKSQVIKQSHNQFSCINLGLRGKICFPLKHKLSEKNIFLNSKYTLNSKSQYNITKQDKNDIKLTGSSEDILIKQKQLVSPCSQNKIGENKAILNTGKRFLLPKFS